MVCAALIDSGKPVPAPKNAILKKAMGINAIVSGGRLFFAVIQGADGAKLRWRMLAPLPRSGAL
jgi:hypothetical protein